MEELGRAERTKFVENELLPCDLWCDLINGWDFFFPLYVASEWTEKKKFYSFGWWGSIESTNIHKECLWSLLGEIIIIIIIIIMRTSMVWAMQVLLHMGVLFGPLDYNRMVITPDVPDYFLHERPHQIPYLNITLVIQSLFVWLFTFVLSLFLMEMG